MIALLHLSDIHVRATANTIAARVDAVAAALRSEALALRACFIAVSGDIAFSGLPTEYKLAADFLSALKTRLASDHPSARVEYVVVPGNHDCDFARPTEMRDFAITNLPKGNALDFNGEIVNSCLSVQEHFFDFTTNLTGQFREGSTRLYGEYRYTIAGHEIEFHLYNTAWLSRRHETPGALFFPVSLASDRHVSAEPAAVTIALLHHPVNWFDPTNARKLRGYLERTCDIVLTGHEHVPSRSKRATDTGAEVAYVEGAVLQASDGSSPTGFNIVWLDIDTRRQMLATYSWSGDMYSPAGQPSWTGFARNPLLAQQAFENDEQWAESLDDPGTAFTHPRRSKLHLSDLFVYPDLTRRSVDPVIGKKDRRVDSREVLEFLATQRKVILTGPSDSGKTSLAKRLYMDLRQRLGSVPVLVEGKALHKVKSDDFLKVLVRAFGEQYTPNQSARYKQLDSSRRLVLVDDFEQAKLSRKGRTAFIRTVTEFAGSVFIFADDLFMIDRLSQSARERDDGLAEFEHCAIRGIWLSVAGRANRTVARYRLRNGRTAGESGLSDGRNREVC